MRRLAVIICSLLLTLAAHAQDASVLLSYVTAGEANYTAMSYVQNGLVFMFDGIENAGWGIHASSTNRWKELIGGSIATIVNYQGYEWEQYGFRSDINHQYMYHPVTINNATSGTVEVCYSEADYAQSITSGNFGPVSAYPLTVNGSWGMAYYRGTSGKSWIFSKVNPWDYKIADGLVSEGYFVQTMTASSVNSNKVGYVYQNGLILKSGLDFNNTDPVVNHKIHFMRSNGNENLAAYYHSFRIYNRPLTPSEVAHNYAVDKARFGL